MLKLNENMRLLNRLVKNSNTTLVKVKLYKEYIYTRMYPYSNTTLVKVKSRIQQKKKQLKINSNTTLVKVKLFYNILL